MPSPNPVLLRTSDGIELEAALTDADGDRLGAIALTHPHPTYGGDMHAGFVGLLPDLVARRGVCVLRWNFRGVGRSGGSHGGGVDERLDVVAALDHLVGLDLGVPILLGGWSFGADVSLAVDDDRHAGWLAVAAPLASAGDGPPAATDARPKRLLVPEHDQFRDPDAAAEATAGWAATTLVTIPGTDHFLGGRTSEIADQLVGCFSG
ncbi:MAG: hypothetical protein AAFZ07_27835 [Actinomycetota bacterium]